MKRYKSLCLFYIRRGCPEISYGSASFWKIDILGSYSSVVVHISPVKSSLMSLPAMASHTPLYAVLRA